MEELAPHNAYHAKWAVEALLSASRGGVALEGYAGSKAILQGMEDATRTCPPGEVEVTCRVGKEAQLRFGIGIF